MKKEPWRIAVSIISLLFIAVLWVKKDVGATFAALGENAFPVLVISIGVSLFKVLLFAGAAFLLRWLLKKMGGRK